MLIEKHIPDCRVAIGHGQMKPEELEKIIMGFINYDYDVLLATTIIESGIDIPNANTIIINQAQNFGLSDLHQMRGRVGAATKKLSVICWHLLCHRLLLKPNAGYRPLKTLVIWEAAFTLPCRILISAEQEICWEPSRADLLLIWAMKPIRRF